MSTETRSISVRLSPEYPVVVGLDTGDVISKTVSPGAVLPGACVIVTDSTVAPLHLDDVRGSLEAAGFDVLACVTVPAGEASKNLAVYAEVLGEVARSGLGRDGIIFALGGGVVGDLGGFVAASYMRGVRLVMLPTTLLAMVDSSVGGKVGVDLPEGKNLVGAFHQPGAVVADISRLETLPEREISGGLAEVIKMGLLSGGGYFDDLSLITGAMNRDPEALIRLVEHSVRYKASVVARDEKEGGLRAVLNYGHTIGHGLEAASGYTLSHGESISLGMVCAAEIGKTKTKTRFDVTGRQRELLEAAGLPTKLSGYDTDSVLRAMGRDKKRSSKDGAHRFVLLEAVGAPVFGVPVTDDEVIEAMEVLEVSGK